MRILWLASVTILLLGCGKKHDVPNFGDGEGAYGNQQPTDINDNYKDIDHNTPPGEHVVKVLYAAGTKRVYLLKNGTKETRTKGTRSWRNNNEGNLEYGPFARRHYAVGKDPRFAIFPSEYLGIEAKKKLIFEGKYRNLSLWETIKAYAPPKENKTVWYYKTVKSAVGSDKRMQTYTNAEKNVIIHAMRKVEGWRKGKVYREQPKRNTCYERESC